MKLEIVTFFLKNVLILYVIIMGLFFFNSERLYFFYLRYILDANSLRLLNFYCFTWFTLRSSVDCLKFYILMVSHVCLKSTKMIVVPPLNKSNLAILARPIVI
jgi:hypothetical protein